MDGNDIVTESEEPPGTADPESSTERSALTEAERITRKVSYLSITTYNDRKPRPRVRPRPPNAEAVSPRAQAFYRAQFPGTGPAEWNDWHWQIRNRICRAEDLQRIFRLTDDEREALIRHHGSLPLGITPYYASLIDPEDARHPLRRTMIPVTAEYRHAPHELVDPLGEDDHSPVPGLVHRYPDRALFLVTNFCSANCRYCTRSRIIGNHAEYKLSVSGWERALEYIGRHPEIRDVLLSGGDPLTLPDAKLDWLLSRLRAIPHVEFIRIGSKVPMVLPQRITRSLVRILRSYHPLWMSIHVTHPEELTPEAAQACTRLADAGIPLGSQTVLLAGINDDVATMKSLMHGLLKIRVRPYYLYQCDPIVGSAHFRTPVRKGLEIIQGLRGHTTGYAVPTYVIDSPGGGGKVPLLPDYFQGYDGEEVVLRNYEGKLYRYPDAE
jgi:lysine 2,3-aminomutase